MKFEIERASVSMLNIPKCQNEKQVLKLVDLPKGYNASVKMGEPVCFNGKLFIDSNGRKRFEPKIYIEINTLEELLGLIKEVGSLVVEEETIIIYDDYLE